MKSSVLTLLFIVALLSNGLAQNRYSFNREINIPVYHGNDTLENPWAGGLNHPVFNSMDVNFDGLDDLIAYDRSSYRVSVFVREVINGKDVYRYHPEYADAFPLPKNKGSFILLRDFNCDGKKDIFFNNGSFYKVFENTSTGNQLQFSPYNNGQNLKTEYSSGVSDLYTSLADLPLIADLDGDGDLDIATFGNGGVRIEFHENISSSGCGLDFKQTDNCWGGFVEGGFWRTMFLGACTGSNKRGQGKTLHEGSAMLTWDLNNSGLDDLLISNVEFSSMSALFNTGTTDSAYFSSQDTLYPSQAPINHYIFPAPYRVEATFDAVDDLLISSYSSTASGSGDASSDHEGVLRYENTGTNNNPNFVLREKNFLQGEMIDFGSNATPRLVDINGDGLVDLIVATGRRFMEPSVFQSQLYYYENTGTATQAEFTLRDTNFANVLGDFLGEDLIPTFGDLDGDGDLDMILGAQTGYFHYYRNDGDQFNPNFNLHTPIISNTDVGANASPYLYDIDDDGDLDLFVGNQRGKVWFFENQSSSSPDFSLKNNFFGAIDVSQLAFSGNASPVLLKDSSGTTIFVGSTERGVIQFDNIDSVAQLPSVVSDTLGNLATTSNNFNESPFGSDKRSGRNQILIRADELTAKGYMRGYIASLSFNITTKGADDLSQGINIRIKNVQDSVLSDFENNFPGDAAVTNFTIRFNRGWVTIPLTFPHLWDGQSNLLIEICFSGNFPSPATHVAMSNTSYPSYAYGNMTGYNTFTADGCTMPYQTSINKRPDMMINLTPASNPLPPPENPNILFTGIGSAPAFAAPNGEGFLDAVVGNRSGGLSLFYGRLYDVGLPDSPLAEKLSRFDVYPNPSNGSINIDLKPEAIGIFDELRIINLQGQVVYRQKIEQSQNQVQLTQLPEGMYMIIVQGSGQRETQRLMLRK